MNFDAFLHQLPDADPQETTEWLDSLNAVASQKGRQRASYLMAQLLDRSEELDLGTPPTVTTPYINTIPVSEQPWYPGDVDIEKRIRALIRWNAVAMVIRANKQADGIGGHLSTFASSALLYDVGFNHFFKGKDNGTPGDHVYVQGHAAPGIYARSFLEGRLSAEQLDGFRRELSGGISSYPHPRLMPHYWEYPTVSMGLGPINSIYHARFNKYLSNRRIDDEGGSQVWCFVGDGETDEPETLGAISLAARENLGNLVWVINCNLQRLDGPVRGNGKIIQQLESVFRGAGWNVLKVIWGSEWDDLLARDTDGVLLEQMNNTVDGQFQRYPVAEGSYIRDNFFGPDQRLRQMVEHLSDDELRKLPRGGHDYKKVYAAYRAAMDETERPTVILAKTVKGWALGQEVESRNATHQIKKMAKKQLMELRERLHLTELIDESGWEDELPPLVRLPEGSEELKYLERSRKALGGSLPKRVVRNRRPMAPPSPTAFEEFDSGSGENEVSTTLAFTRLLRNLTRDPDMGERVVPIVPDEARTFGMDGLFKELKIYASEGQRYEPIDHHLLLSYAESSDGQILEEGITEAGAMASWTAAATSYSNRGVPMLPFFIFYSMFGFQRVGDLIWAAADSRARGFLLGATAGRTTLMGEGLQHQDGHSLVLASTVPTCRAYDPAFAYEMATLVKEGTKAMYERGEDAFYYLTLYNENIAMPPVPTHLSAEELTDGITGGIYLFEPSEGTNPDASILFSGSAYGAAREAREILSTRYKVDAELMSVTSYKALREDALEVQRSNRLHPNTPAARSRVEDVLGGSDGPVVAVSDFMAIVPDQIARWVSRPWVSLGTDGFGRSDTREELREFFEIDAPHIVVAVLSELASKGTIGTEVVTEAITEFDLDADRTPAWRVDQ